MLQKIKTGLFRLLCNNVTGNLIHKTFKERIPDVRWGNYAFSVRSGSVNRSMIAAIFWGFYESAEIRFIEKYLDPENDVLELGGSIGVVSSHIASKLHGGKKLVVVEANPYLKDTILTNVRRHVKNQLMVEVVNCAIGYGNEKLKIAVTDNNTETRVVSSQALGDFIEIDSITVASLYSRYNLSAFTLICDIEGSEVEIFLNENECLRDCRQLIIELHDTTYNNKSYSINDIRNLIEARHGFKLIEHDGPVFYYQK